MPRGQLVKERGRCSEALLWSGDVHGYSCARYPPSPLAQDSVCLCIPGLARAARDRDGISHLVAHGGWLGSVALQGDNQRLVAAMDIQLFENVMDVLIDGAFGDAQGGGDLTAAHPLAN